MNIYTRKNTALRKYYPACSGKMQVTEKEMDEVVKKFETFCTLTVYNLLFTNDIISGYINDVLSEFQKSSYYRQERKRMSKQVQRERLAYEKRIFGVVKDLAEFFGDSADNFQEHSDIQAKIDTLFWSIKQVFDDKKVEDSYMLARIETARTLLDLSVKQYDFRMKDMHQLDARFAFISLDYLRLTDACKWMNRLADSFRTSADINLNTERVNKAVQILVRRLDDTKAIEKSIKIKIE